MTEAYLEIGNWIRQVLEYNPDTGEFYWIQRVADRVHIGDIAGTVAGNGYRYIEFRGKVYRAARLAWFFVTGENPVGRIDHENRIRDDDRFTNLRLTNSTLNMANSSLSKRNSSGFKGVSWNKKSSKWCTKIQVDGKLRHVGYFDNRADAAKAYSRAAIEAWGEFSNAPSDEEIDAVCSMIEGNK